MRVLGLFILLIFSWQVMASVDGMCCVKEKQQIEKAENPCPHHHSQKSEDSHDNKNSKDTHQSCQKLCCLNIVSDMKMPTASYLLGYSWQIVFDQQIQQPKKIITLLFRPPIA